jgi:hypothetical protein
MIDPEVEELCAYIGNLIRLAAIVKPRDARALCQVAEEEALHAVLLNPRQVPVNQRDNVTNYKLLHAFAQFRGEIEAIRDTPEEDSDSVD